MAPARLQLTIIASAAGMAVRVAEVVEDFELPAALSSGVADHAIELGIFGVFAALLLVEIDAELLERHLALEHVHRAAAERWDIVERCELRELAERAIQAI